GWEEGGVGWWKRKKKGWGGGKRERTAGRRGPVMAPVTATGAITGPARHWPCLSDGSFEVLNPAAVDGTGTDDVEPHWGEARQIRVCQHVHHIIRAEHLPLMQADQDVAPLNPAAGRR